MNKTVNMNLGGIFFHIDEDAYQKLNRYFDAIKSSLDAEAREEIMNDIESRIAEIFSTKLTHNKQVLGLSDVDDVVAIMGQPEDYKIENDEKSTSSVNYTSSKSKKLYRDVDNRKIAGVCAGLGHYFGVDSVWIRIILVLLVFAGFGTGILAYIILWAVTPEAITTSEKLEMTGEPITISNIEKKVKEEFDTVTQKFKSADYSEMGNQVKSGAQKVGSSLGDVIVSIAKVFAKLIGVFIVFISGITLIALLISLFTFGSTEFLKMPWIDYFNSFNYTNSSIWFISLLFFLAIGIPFFFFLLLGLKILVSNLRSIGNIAKLTLLALWLIAVGILISLGIRQASEFEYENKVVAKEKLNLVAGDTLKIKFKYNEFYTKDFHHNDFRLVQDSLGTTMIYSNEVRLEIKPTDETSPYILVEKNANGKSFDEARKLAEKINYKFKIEGKTLVLDNYFLADAKNKFRDQNVSIYLYIPKGMFVIPDGSVYNYDRSDNDYFEMDYDSGNNIYLSAENQLKCLNCPTDSEKDEEDERVYDNDDVDITINENGLKIKNKKDTIINPDEIKELKISEDGIIIKTK